MSQSSRQFKLNGKLQQKNHHKSSLPIIDPLHSTKSKFVTPSPGKPAFKNVRKISRNNQPASNIINGEVQGSVYEKKTSVNQNEQSKSEKKILAKLKSADAQNELNTATTINIEEDINFKETDIKDTELKGLDMWALNKNLKQFSQTRKVAFFKLNSQKQKNQTSTVSKNKTQQIKSMYKIYGGNPALLPDSQKEHAQTQRKIRKINQNITKRKHSIEPHPYSTFSKTKISSPLGNTLYGTLPVRKHGSDLNTTLYMKQKKTLSQNKTKDSQTLPSDINPYLRTFINGSHLKREPSSRKIQILELKNFTPRANQNPNTIEKSKEKKPNNFRRNRFEKILTDETSGAESQKLTNNVEQHLSKESYKEKQNKAKNEQPIPKFDENRQINSSEGKCRNQKQKQAQEKKRQYEYHRSIQKISKSLLKNTEDYMDNYQTFSVMPSSKIQFFIDSLNHPEFSGVHNEYKSTYQGLNPSEVKDEFSFTEPIKSPHKQKGKNTNKSKNKQGKKQKGGHKN